MLLTRRDGAGRRLNSRPGECLPGAMERNWVRPVRRAGASSIQPENSIHESVYPRRRGGTFFKAQGSSIIEGQSPQARGNLRPTRREGASFRHGDSHIGWGVPCVGRGIREGLPLGRVAWYDAVEFRNAARQGLDRKEGGGWFPPPFFFERIWLNAECARKLAKKCSKRFCRYI